MSDSNFLSLSILTFSCLLKLSEDFPKLSYLNVLSIQLFLILVRHFMPFRFTRGYKLFSTNFTCFSCTKWVSRCFFKNVCCWNFHHKFHTLIFLVKVNHFMSCQRASGFVSFLTKITFVTFVFFVKFTWAFNSPEIVFHNSCNVLSPWLEFLQIGDCFLAFCWYWTPEIKKNTNSY